MSAKTTNTFFIKKMVISCYFCMLWSSFTLTLCRLDCGHWRGSSSRGLIAHSITLWREEKVMYNWQDNRVDTAWISIIIYFLLHTNYIIVIVTSMIFCNKQCWNGKNRFCYKLAVCKLQSTAGMSCETLWCINRISNNRQDTVQTLFY